MTLSLYVGIEPGNRKRCLYLNLKHGKLDRSATMAGLKYTIVMLVFLSPISYFNFLTFMCSYFALNIVLLMNETKKSQIIQTHHKAFQPHTQQQNLPPTPSPTACQLQSSGSPPKQATYYLLACTTCSQYAKNYLIYI